jgi:2-isopropylmalate synthase
MSDQVRVFDTTLRDGEQSPGATMTTGEKLEVARALRRAGVDVIEAGFPAASPDDLAAVRAIAEEVGRSDSAPIVCGLARATRDDLELCWRAVSPAERPRIHTFLATSDLHLTHKLRISRRDAVERVKSAVSHARALCADVEFSPEDASRSDPEFLFEVLETAIRAGATTLNIPDTVGYATPEEYGALIAAIRTHVRGVDGVILSVHCHDDLGLAVANSLSGLRAGARQVEVAVNGIGERAGNCALEELVMALRTRAKVYGLSTNVDTTQLTRLSRLVSSSTGMVVAPNKAIIGSNAFAHESGIHQDGMLKHMETYEIMRPETVGAGETRLVLGKHSGRHAFAKRIEELGYDLDERELERAFQQFKRVAERKKHVGDADLDAIVAAERPDAGPQWQLQDLEVASGTSGLPTASVRLRAPDGGDRVAAAVGTGPVDAAFRAVDQLVQAPATLHEYTVRSVTEGIDSLAEVSVRIGAPGDRVWHGHGADTDVIVASVKAYLAGLNRMVGSSRTEQLKEAAQ